MMDDMGAQAPFRVGQTRCESNWFARPRCMSILPHRVEVSEDQPALIDVDRAVDGELIDAMASD